MNNRTPTPWHVNTDDKTTIFNSMGGYVTRIDGNAVQTRAAIENNAAFIVTACNAYDAHVARIAELEAALRECITESGAACYNIAKKTRRLEAINETARAALAKGQA